MSAQILKEGIVVLQSFNMSEYFYLFADMCIFLMLVSGFLEPSVEHFVIFASTLLTYVVRKTT